MTELSARASPRARLNRSGSDETHFLAPVEEGVALGRTSAEQILAKYAGDGNATPTGSSSGVLRWLNRGLRGIVGEARHQHHRIGR